MGKTAKENGSTKTNSKIKNTPSLIQKIPYKKWQFWAIVGGACAVIAVLVLFITHKDYKIEDLTGKPVNEACSIARSHGWTVKEPILYGGNDSDERNLQITCDNTMRDITNRYTYDTDSHIVILTWGYRELGDIKGKTVAEACREIESLGLALGKPEYADWVKLGYKNNIVASCTGEPSPAIMEEYQNNDSNAIISSSYQTGGRVYMGIKAVEEQIPDSGNKCVSGTAYSIQDYWEYYVVGKDIPAGTYKRTDKRFTFDLYDSPRAKLFGVYHTVDMHDSGITLKEGQIITGGLGDIVCE